MSLTCKQYNSLLSQLDSNIEQAERQLQQLKNQRRISQFFSDLQEVESGELIVLGQEDPIFSLIESSPTFFNVSDITEIEVPVTRNDGKLSIETTDMQRSFIQESELVNVNNETSTVKTWSRRVARAWAYAPDTPIVSVAGIEQQPAFTPTPGPQVSMTLEPSTMAQ